MSRTRSPTRLAEIVEAATRTFIRQGYRLTSIDEIAAAAEVAPGTVYLYVKGKEALFDLVMQRAFGDESALEVPLPHAIGSPSALQELVWQRLQEAAAFPLLRSALTKSEVRDVRLEFEGIVVELYRWLLRYRRAIKLIERCALDWPELHALFYKQFRAEGLDQLTAYLGARMQPGGPMRQMPDVATAARGMLELIAWFAMHRFTPADSSAYDDVIAEETIKRMLSLGFLGVEQTSAELEGGVGVYQAVTATKGEDGMVHALTILGLITAIAALCLVGRVLGTNSRQLRRYEWSLAGVVALLWAGYLAFDFATTGWDLKQSLPLQLCDFAAIVAAWSFAQPNRAIHAIAYFWGLALSTQALITPDLVGGPATLAFWAFWLYHLFVVGAGVYVVAVRGFRPELRDLLTAVGVGLLYVAVIFSIDATFDVNYGYLGRAKPGRPTILDLLGPWPLRVVNMSAIAISAMTLLWLPWEFGRRRRR